MPQLDELVKERQAKKFTKKNYRPWDLTGNKKEPLDVSLEEPSNLLSNIENNSSQEVLSLEKTSLDRDKKCLNIKGSINTINRPLSVCLEDLRSNPLRLIKFLFSLAEIEDGVYKTRRVKLK